MAPSVTGHPRTPGQGTAARHYLPNQELSVEKAIYFVQQASTCLPFCIMVRIVDGRPVPVEGDNADDPSEAEG